MTKIKELMKVPEYVGQKIVIKKPNYGINCDIQDKAMEVNVDSVGPRKAVNLGLKVGQLRLATLALCITEAPFFMVNGQAVHDTLRKYQIVRDLPSNVGDYIYNEIESLKKNSVIPEVVREK